MMTVSFDAATIRHWLEQVPDPEIPAISIVDLGIVRAVQVDDDAVTVTITPTYSGCPAMQVIATAVRHALEEQGVQQVRIATQLSPPWTTDWMSEAGKEKLRDYGIAPPGRKIIDTSSLAAAVSRRANALPSIACPLCGSTDTALTSQFGSTPCKALYRCRACREPFDHFKCH